MAPRVDSDGSTGHVSVDVTMDMDDVDNNFDDIIVDEHDPSTLSPVIGNTDPKKGPAMTPAQQSLKKVKTKHSNRSKHSSHKHHHHHHRNSSQIMPDGSVVSFKDGVEIIDETNQIDPVTGRNIYVGGIPVKDIDLNPPVLSVPQPKIVGFDENDPENPKNFPIRTKIKIILVGGAMAFGSSFGSSVFTPAIPIIAEIYGVGIEVGILGLSLYVLGFGFGPLVFGPMSEIYGRRMSLFPAYFIFCCFMIAAATSRTLEGLLIERFFCGFFASAPFSSLGGSISDLFEQRTRALAVVFYSLSIMGGPTLGPLIGSVFIIRDDSYRWTMYVPFMVACTVFTLGFFCIDETYPPVLLVRKAARIRYQTGDITYRGAHELRQFTFHYLMNTYFMRPIKMLMYEPIMIFMTIYCTFVYSILYMNFESIPIVFEEVRHWNTLTTSCVFLAITVGVFAAGGIQILSQLNFIKRVDRLGPRPPEERLFVMMGGAFVFAIGLFWFAWSSSPHVHFMMPIVGAGLVGMGFLLIFQNGLNYLVDCFAAYAASAISATTFVRSCVAAAFPLIARPMYHSLGVEWASSLLAFVSVALIPMPFIFYVYGERIRAMSKYRPTLT